MSNIYHLHQRRLAFALWKMWRRGAVGSEIQLPTCVAEKIYPLENVGYHCRDPPLNGFQLCSNCCQGDWSRCLSCRDHLLGLLAQTRGLTLSYWFPHPICPGSIITDMQSNIQKTLACPLIIDSQSGPEEPHNQLSRKKQTYLPGRGLVGMKDCELFHSFNACFLWISIALIIRTRQFSTWLYTVLYCSLIVSPPR